jgi:hypothetical protein
MAFSRALELSCAFSRSPLLSRRGLPWRSTAQGRRTTWRIFGSPRWV